MLVGRTKGKSLGKDDGWLEAVVAASNLFIPAGINAFTESTNTLAQVWSTELLSAMEQYQKWCKQRLEVFLFKLVPSCYFWNLESSCKQAWTGSLDDKKLVTCDRASQLHMCQGRYVGPANTQSPAIPPVTPDAWGRPDESFRHMRTAWWIEWVIVAQSWTLCEPMDYSLPGSSVHGILQARILEWVAWWERKSNKWLRF